MKNLLSELVRVEKSIQIVSVVAVVLFLGYLGFTGYQRNTIQSSPSISPATQK